MSAVGQSRLDRSGMSGQQVKGEEFKGGFLVGAGPGTVGRAAEESQRPCCGSTPLPVCVPGGAEQGHEARFPPLSPWSPGTHPAGAPPLPPQGRGQPQRLRCEVRVGQNANSEPRLGGPWGWPQSPSPAFQRKRVLQRKLQL